MEVARCPECGAYAEVEWRAELESTDGSIEHAKIRCLQRHWFMLPTAALSGSGSRSRPHPSGGALPRLARRTSPSLRSPEW